jgi:hypothetical protein
MDWKVVFMGPVGGGKTQAIRSISDIEVVNTDELATDETQSIKSHTTVSMDVGALHLAGTDKLRLYGAPGQDRFDFMWDILLAQSKGVILIINHSNPDPVADLEHYLQALEQRAAGRRFPVVIGVTHGDLKPSVPLDIYRDHLNARGCKASIVLPPVLDLDARNKNHVYAALVVMTALLEMAERFPNVTPSRSTRIKDVVGTVS